MITIPNLLLAVALLLAPFGILLLLFAVAWAALNLYAIIWADRCKRLRRERQKWRETGYAEGYLAARLEYGTDPENESR